jgi:hypothetical protein
VLGAQSFDPRLHLGPWPVLEQPSRQRLIGVADQEHLVLIGAPVGEQLQGMRLS